MILPADLPRPIVALLRVSRDSQDVAAQRSAIEGYATLHGLTIDNWLTPEEGVSGDSVKREALEAVMELVDRKQIGTLAAASIDRIGRRGGATMVVMEELHRAGVSVVAVQDGGIVDLGDDDGEMIAGLKAILARRWLKQHRRKVKDALNARDARGRRVSVRNHVLVGRPGVELDPDVLASVLQRRASETLAQIAPTVPGYRLRMTWTYSGLQRAPAGTVREEIPVGGVTAKMLAAAIRRGGR